MRELTKREILTLIENEVVKLSETRLRNCSHVNSYEILAQNILNYCKEYCNSEEYKKEQTEIENARKKLINS